MGIGYASLLALMVLLGRGAVRTAMGDAARRDAFPLRFVTERIDAGGMPLSKPAHFEFQLANTARRRVHIRQVAASCGCVNATASKREIGPGETAVIRADLTPSLGKVTKEVRVHVQESDVPKTLWLQATFTNGILTDEPTVDLGETPQGGTLSRVVVLHVEPWARALPITALSERGLVRAEVVGPPGAERSLRLSLAPGAACAPVDGAQDAILLYLGTTANGSPALTLGVSFRVNATVDLDPEQAAFGFRPVGDASQVIDVHGRQAFKIVSAKSDDPRVIARWRQASETAATVSITANCRRPATLVASVTIAFANKQQRRVQVTGRFLGEDEWRRWRASTD